jgi:uncharacterized radical SAM protein YgiQ
MTREYMAARGWDELDVLLVSGDAYVDHPSFGIPLLGRVLEAKGYRVGIVAQPRWDSPADVARMGRPRLFCGISAGCIDSMLAHYTAFRKKRRDDAYTPGGKDGARPNRACIVYANLVRQAFQGLPIVLGGIEASLRRAVHYDFWSDSLRRSLLFDAKADLLLYGMGERSIVEVAGRLTKGQALDGIRGSAWIGDGDTEGEPLPSLEEIEAKPRKLLDATMALEAHVQRASGTLLQAHGPRVLAIGPPAEPLDTAELDAVYELPFTRLPHPSYDQPIPAFDMVRWSISAVRGCGGGCSFCSLALHQGRRLRSRSSDSILREVRKLRTCADWHGAISDVGGPTANLWGASCTADPSQCRRTSCLVPHICPHLKAPQNEYLNLLRRLSGEAGVKHVRVASGVRFDLALREPEFAMGLTREFVGGQLKLAPEHSVPHVLKLMRKMDFSLFERFLELFEKTNKQTGQEQYVIPYVMSAFPGCTMSDMQALRGWFRQRGWNPQQVQCFIPTPGTVATAMFFAGCDPDGRPIHVARTDREREDQHAALVGRRKGKPGPTGGNKPPPGPRRGSPPRRGTRG